MNFSLNFDFHQIILLREKNFFSQFSLINFENWKVNSKYKYYSSRTTKSRTDLYLIYFSKLIIICYLIFQKKNRYYDNVIHHVSAQIIRKATIDPEALKQRMAAIKQKKALDAAAAKPKDEELPAQGTTNISVPVNTGSPSAVKDEVIIVEKSASQEDSKKEDVKK